MQSRPPEAEPGFHAVRVATEGLPVGIVSLLAVVTLRQDFAGAAGGDSSAYLTAGASLVAVHDWTFLLGPAGSSASGTG
jgi:hypothetical protein